MEAEKIKVGKIEFGNVREKAAYLQEKAVRDSTSRLINEWAAQFAAIPSKKNRAAAILRFVQLAIEYRPDPGVEVLDSSAVALVRGYGDCDVKSRAMVALCLASDIPARTLPVIRGESFPHILTEVFLDAEWVAADPCVVNSKIGEIPRVGVRTEWRAR